MARADTPNITPAAICVPPPPAVKISAIEPSPPNAGNTMSQLDAPAEAGSGIDGAGRTSTRRIAVFGGSRRGGRLNITTATTSPPSRVSAATNAARGGWCCAGSAEGRDDATLRVGVVGRRVRQSGDDRGEHACEVVRGLLPLPLLHEIGSLCVTAPALHERLQVGCEPVEPGPQPTCSRSCRAGAVTHRLPISCRSGSGSRPRTTSHACSPRSSSDWRTRRPTTPTRSVASSRPSADPAQHHPPRAALVAALTLEGGLVVAVVMFKRPPRREPPKTAMRRVDVRPPPSMPEPASAGASSWLMVLPALGGLGSMALIFTAGGGGTHIAAGVMFGVSALAMAGGSLARVGGDRNRKVDRERRSYQRHLAHIRRQARAAAADQAESLFWVHPDPRGLLSLVRTSRLWERRPADPDFATLRLGVGDCVPAMDLLLDDSKQAQDVDMVSAVSLRRFLRAHETVPALPVAVSLREFGRVTLEGEPAACLSLIHISEPTRP